MRRAPGGLTDGDGLSGLSQLQPDGISDEDPAKTISVMWTEGCWSLMRLPRFFLEQVAGGVLLIP